ncbi:hypothetical protein D6D01_10132 [Aureobasidium pullulans]|uniref:Uncharacterized protein n=1 Tax=Aureobasidium pullulans TaxID=5580 RepID=A0A4S9JNM7_AURPU|nr:hypothetical protein D6D01_10132 [Aureobasidium pullulans]
MLDPLNSTSLDGNHSSIQPDIRPIKSLRPKIPTSRQGKQVAFVPTMKILMEEFPQDEEESSVGAFSHTATRKIIEPSPLPHSIFSRMKHNYELSKGSSQSETSIPQQTEGSSNLDTRFTEEFFNHRKEPSRMSTKLESSAPALGSIQQSLRHQRCSSNSSNYSNVAVHGPPNAAISESGAPPSYVDRFAYYGQDPSRIFGSSDGGEHAFVSSATQSAGGPVNPRAIRRKPAVSNFSMISTLAVWGSERSTSPAADLDRSYGKQPPLRDMLGPEWYELLRDSAVEPEQLCEDLVEYFAGLGISGRLVYCFGFCANESAIRLKPLRDGYRISNGSYSIAPDIRTITIFTRPAQMLLLDSDDPASSPIEPVPCIELTDGLTKSVHHLQHEQDDRGTTQGTIQASSPHLYVDCSLEPITSKEVYAAVEVYCPNWFKNNRKPPVTAGASLRDYRGPGSPSGGGGAGAFPCTPSDDAAAGSAVGHGAVNDNRRHRSTSQAPTRHTAAKHLTNLINAKSLPSPATTPSTLARSQRSRRSPPIAISLYRTSGYKGHTTHHYYHPPQCLNSLFVSPIEFVKRSFFALFNDRSHNKAKTHTTASTYTAASIQAAVNEYIRFEDFLRSVGRGNPVFASLLGDIQECCRFASEMEKEEGYSDGDEFMEEEGVEEIGRQLQLMAVSSTEDKSKGKDKRSRDDEDVEVILKATKEMKL